MKRFFKPALIIVLGLFYLFSGLIKIIDIDDFLYLIRSYHFKAFIYLAPIVPIVEVVLAYFLIFRINQKKALAFSIILLIGFTLIFSYGHFFLKIDDCGCFGGVDFLKMSPFMFYLRNGLLLFLSYFLYDSVKPQKTKTTSVNYALISILAIFVLSVVWLNTDFKQYTQKIPYSRNTIDAYHNSFINQNIHETIFDDYAKTAEDSSYLVFVFSFDCPHCMVSAIHLNDYVKNGVVDKIVAIANGSRAEERFFNENVPVQFDYQKIKHIEMSQITGFHPLSFYVENDTIRFKVKGTLPDFKRFKDLYFSDE